MRQALTLLNRVGEVGRGLAAGGRPSRQTSQSRHPLLQDLDALEPRHRREMACALAVLWEDFGADLGGDAGYLSHTPAERAEYVTFLRQGAHRVRQNGGQEKLHFALAAEMMALYVEAIGAAVPSLRDRETASTIASIAAQGTLIRRAGAGLRHKKRHLNG
jgi:hypothetical protein